MRRHQAINGGIGAAVTLAMATTISIQLAALAAAGALRPTTTAVPAVYVFGDSLLDVGNNNYLPGADVPRANMPYYGVDFPGGARPTGRFSNGYNVADLVGMYALSTDGALELFASGCAFVLCDTLAQGIERADG